MADRILEPRVAGGELSRVYRSRAGERGWVRRMEATQRAQAEIAGVRRLLATSSDSFAIHCN